MKQQNFVILILIALVALTSFLFMQRRFITSHHCDACGACCHEHESKKS